MDADEKITALKTEDTPFRALGVINFSPSGFEGPLKENCITFY